MSFPVFQDKRNQSSFLYTTLNGRYDLNNWPSPFLNEDVKKIAEKKPESKEEVRDIVVNVAGDLNINLNNQDITNITNVMYNFSQLDIDWKSFGDQLDKLKGQLENLVNSEEAQGWFDEFMAWLSDLFSSIADAFSGK